eukprot:g1887.t1
MLVPMSLLSTKWVRAPDQKDRSSTQKGSSSIPRTPLISPSSTTTQDVGEVMGESREGKGKSVVAPPLAEVEAGYQGGEYDEQGDIAWYYDDKKKTKALPYLRRQKVSFLNPRALPNWVREQRPTRQTPALS